MKPKVEHTVDVYEYECSQGSGRINREYPDIAAMAYDIADAIIAEKRRREAGEVK